MGDQSNRKGPWRSALRLAAARYREDAERTARLAAIARSEIATKGGRRAAIDFVCWSHITEHLRSLAVNAEREAES